MAIDDITTSRFEQLVHQLLEGSLTQEERAELETLLESHNALEDQVLREIEVESALRNLNRSFDVSDRVMARIRSQLAAKDARHSGAGGLRATLTSVGHHPWKVGLAIAAATALIVGAFFVFSKYSATGTMTVQEGLSDGASAQKLSAPGAPVNLNGASHVGLARNTNASITCRNGVQLQLGLEADMTFIKTEGQASEDGRRIRLISGRLRARVPEMPPGAPFTIETTQGVVTVSAAEIELIVTTHATQVRVVSGSAHIERLATHKTLDLPAAQYTLVRDDLELAAHPVQSLRCLFDDDADSAAFWTTEAGSHAVVRRDSRTGAACLRLTPQQGRVSLAGLAVPVREHPQPGECRFVAFAWRKDGGGRIALQFDHSDEPSDRRKQGRMHGYRFDAGEGAPVDGMALRTDGKTPQAWWPMTRDLWQDFGEFTLTGLTFICPDGDAAEFDGIYVGHSPADFTGIAFLRTQPSLLTDMMLSADLPRSQPPRPAAIEVWPGTPW